MLKSIVLLLGLFLIIACNHKQGSLLTPEYLFFAPTYLLPQWSEYLLTLHQSMALSLRNNFYVRLHFQARGGASSLHHRNHTKITVLWVNRSPIRYDFHGSAKAIGYGVKIASLEYV